VVTREARASLTPSDHRALALLVGCEGLVRPGHFGELLWPGHRGAGNCSCPHARPAGKVLKRLERAGLAEWVCESRSWFGWRATAAGRAAPGDDE
jgi:hypothetical protein